MLVRPQSAGATPLFKTKDAQGRPLTESRLRAYAAEYFPWVGDLYEKASRFIHFSDEHMFTSARLSDEEDRGLLLSIAEKQARWSDELIDEFADAFAYITDRLLALVDSWGDHKVAIAARRSGHESPAPSE